MNDLTINDMPEKNKNLIRNYINTVINTGNVESIEQYIHEDYTEIHEGKPYQMGIQGAVEHIQGVYATYPDLYLRVDHQIAEADWVATSYTMRGTHTGEWMNIAPTGKKITVTGVNLDRIQNGKIIEHGGAANLLLTFLKIGAVRKNTPAD